MAGDTKQVKDDEYQEATKAVGDAMRIDMLGPNVVKVLEKYTPAEDTIKKLIEKSLHDTDIESAFGELLQRINRNRKGKWVERGISAGVGALIVIAVTALWSWFKGLVGK